VYSALKAWKDVAVLVCVRGELNDITKAALAFIDEKDLNRVNIVESYKMSYPNLVGTTGALRFTTDEIPYDEVLVTDVDMFFTLMRRDIFDYCRYNKENDMIYVTHGPYHKPHRPEICPEWKGDYERAAAGLVCLYKNWWHKTDIIRGRYDLCLRFGTKIKDFREVDEVILGRIIKESGFSIPKVPLNYHMRPIHYGDFKSTMKHRYTNRNKMRSLLDNRCVEEYLRAKSDKTLTKIRGILSQNAQIAEILDNVDEYCEKRMQGEM
jgi:hypothetical protein